MTSSAADDVASLWLSTLQRAMGRASHDVKDALNGVSVNLEVIRGRAARPDAPAAAVASFAEASAHQLERLTNLIEAVLALGRAERQPTDVLVTLRRVATLCSASASSSDAEVLVEPDGVETASTSVRGDAVRLALAAPLLDLVAGRDHAARASAVRCVVQGTEEGTVVILSAAGRRAEMPEAVADAVRAAGVRVGGAGRGGAATESNDLSLVFPRG